ncbi:tetratricopeptide repeat protein [Phototrophicus methaneseepsis]|uniref:Tetratricopeptide repeat protein n=1 Tax=Phototrophicus methaneseepsis TaxID=2710758 RepID=A0A7S8E624_9CHLR|nr:tetratricopeptide repeat protein [Phototrophicus methaneseepsis]QPC81056.1 tetratricopeptide repeat protein [Phototrophicus methaneseepsis]
MITIFGREAEKRRLAQMLSRYSGGVLGYYGMSGLGKSTVLDLFEQRISEMKFTPYVARLDFADVSLHDVLAAFVYLLVQLESTGATRKRKRGLFRRYSDSPLKNVAQALAPTLNIKQILKINVDNHSVAQHIYNIANVQPGINQAQLNEAMGKFKVGITKLPCTPPFPGKIQGNFIRPLVVVLADTLEQAPDSVLSWLKQLASPMFEEYLLLIAAGQEKIDGLLETSMDRVEDDAIRDILRNRFRIVEGEKLDAVCRIARGNPRCAVLAGELLTQDESIKLDALLPSDINDHLVADYLVKHILNRLPNSSTEKHLLTYGCVLRHWETTEQLRTVLFAVPQVRNIMGQGADIRAALNRLREHSFLDSGHPHPTLRDLLLHDLKQDEHSIFLALHHAASEYYKNHHKYADAIYHLIAIEEWQAVFNLWNALIKLENAPALEQCLKELSARSIPSEFAFIGQVALIESGLILQHDALLMPLLSLVQSELSDDRKHIVNTLTQRALEMDFIPDELRFQLVVITTTELEEQAQALIELADVKLWQERYTESESDFRQAYELYQELGDRLGQANALRSLGEVKGLQNRYVESESNYSQAYDLHRELGDRLGQAHALSGLGEMKRLRGRYTESESDLSRAYELHQELGDRYGQAHALRGLGEVKQSQGRYVESESDLSRAYELYQELGDRHGQADALRGLGEVKRLRGRYTESESDLSRAYELYQELGDRHGQAHALRGLGEVKLLPGRYVESESDYSQAYDLYRELGDRHGQAHALRGLGEVKQSQGRYVESESDYSQAYELYRELGDRHGQAHALRGLGEVKRLQNHYVESESDYSQSYKLYRERGHRHGQANALIGLGEVKQSQGRYVESESDYSQAYELYRELDNCLGQALSCWLLGLLAADREDIASLEKRIKNLETLALQVNTDLRDEVVYMLRDLQSRHSAL